MSARRRIVEAVRALFGGSPAPFQAVDGDWEPPPGGVGVREPVRPRLPTLSGAVALDPPPPELDDVDAAGGR